MITLFLLLPTAVHSCVAIEQQVYQLPVQSHDIFTLSLPMTRSTHGKESGEKQVWTIIFANYLHNSKKFCNFAL